MSTLDSKLAALKEKLNTSMQSEDTTPFPLSAFLILYSKAQRECYIEYMEGARILFKWLSPIFTPPEVWNNLTRIPNLLHSYETRELSKIIAGNLMEAPRMEQCIIKTLIEEHLK